MLGINMADVYNVLNLCKPYLIGFGVVLLLVIIAIIYSRKFNEIKKKLVRSEAGIAALLALVIAVNMICWGPMSTMLSLATGDGAIQDETMSQSLELCTEIAEEGIVLLKNEDDFLPLTDIQKLNVFGWASTNPCYGGTGSGSTSAAYDKVTLIEGLEDAGFEVNKELEAFYVDYRADRPEVGMGSQDWTLPEPMAASYSEELLENTKAYSDTAMVVISRVGGENADLPQDLSKVTYTDNSTDYKDFEDGEHYLQLSQSEKNMLDMVCENFDDVIVVYNGANALELGFIDEYEQIKSAFWCPGTGQNGFDALGEILNGDVNPSGRTSDTFVRDLTAAPYYNNFGDFKYDNMQEVEGEDMGVFFNPTFVNYVEGIYVGYKFYETAAEEGLIDYDEAVVYPFGYGLSYTEFEQEMGEITESNGTLTFDVTVTNVGDTAGKDVVEIYYNPPYTNGGIEKASANLVAFEKTDTLEPGDSQTIVITFDMEDMASYDESGDGYYVLEDGDYEISIRLDSHNVIEEKTYTVKSAIVYDEKNPRTTDQTAAVNQFSDVDGEVTYLSRADGFANYEDAVKAPDNFSMPEEQKKQFIWTENYELEINEDDEMPATGVDNGIELVELRGLDYDDPKWDELLDELTVSEMDHLTAQAGFQTAEIESIGKVQTVDCDGPASINNNFTRIGSIGFPSGVMLASTWNKEIIHRFGESIGRMADDMDVSGWDAPAMNTHRSAFAGRNFEYYSEDGVLAGNLAAAAIQGASEYGVYAYVKHFAFNDQETNRGKFLCTWSNEQALREIYLKPFEIAIKEGGTHAVMASYNYIGLRWAAGSEALLTNILRNEWGFQGFVLTDMFSAPDYMNANQLISSGGDAVLIPYDSDVNHMSNQDSATTVQKLRNASRNILFTVVNSRAYEEENLNKGMPAWQIAAIAIDIVLVAGIIALEAVTILKYRKRASIVTIE